MKPLLFIPFVVITLWSCENQTPGQEQPEVAEISTNTIDSTFYIQQGKNIAQQSFKTLKSHLQTAIKNGGPNNAIKFCNTKALPLTDSLSNAFGAKIQRISHRPRNPKNQANNQEQTIIKKYINTHAQQPTLVADNNHITFYAPIYTKPVCLMCHGTPNKNIQTDTYQLITQLYPNDKAINFKENDLRGLWKITFTENK